MMRFASIFLIALITSSVSSSKAQLGQINDCYEHGDCISNSEDCVKKCGCGFYSAVLVYNETTEECDVNVKLLLQNLTEKHNTQANIIFEAETVFRGIILSVIIFAACAGVCVLSACFYCCRINYTDNLLKKDVDALTAKMKRENRYKKLSVKVPAQVAENCNIIVEDAGVYCV